MKTKLISKSVGTSKSCSFLLHYQIDSQKKTIRPMWYFQCHTHTSFVVKKKIHFPNDFNNNFPKSFISLYYALLVSVLCFYGSGIDIKKSHLHRIRKKTQETADVDKTCLSKCNSVWFASELFWLDYVLSKSNTQKNYWRFIIRTKNVS